MTKNRSAQRSTLIAERRAIAPGDRKKWDAEIAEQVYLWCEQHQIKSAGVYSPIQAEPSIYEVYARLKALGITLALPAVPSSDNALVFAVWSPGDELMKDRFGVPVPLDSAPIIRPEVLFIPCVGFTEDCYRLGYGGGFYDRTLALRPRPKTVGIAYLLSRCEMEIQAHDIALDTIITNY